jgi:hypothetical protein
MQRPVFLGKYRGFRFSVRCLTGRFLACLKRSFSPSAFDHVQNKVPTINIRPAPRGPSRASTAWNTFAVNREGTARDSTRGVSTRLRSPAGQNTKRFFGKSDRECMAFGRHNDAGSPVSRCRTAFPGRLFRRFLDGPERPSYKERRLLHPETEEPRRPNQFSGGGIGHPNGL